MSDEDNVLLFNGVTTLDFPAELMLKKAMDADLESVVILGYRKDGEGFYASSIADGGTVLWLLENCKKALLDQ